MGKRGQGEGSWHRRENGLWVYRVSTPAGRKTFYGRTKTEAAAKHAAVRDRLASGKPLPDATLTVGAFLDRWLAEAVRPHLAYRTWTTYESHARVHLKPALGRVRLARLTALDVQAFLNRKLAAGLAPATVCALRTTLRRALAQAVAWGLVADNAAAAGIALPKRAAPEPPALTVEQARALLAAVRGDRLEALWLLAATLGLRQGEALGLRWADVDFAAGVLRVRRSLQWQGRGDERRWVLKEPKTAKSRRDLPLPDNLAAALRRHKTRQAAARLRSGAAWQDHDLIFCTRHGTPLDQQNVTHRFHQLVPADLPHLRFHDLRHCCGSTLTALGVPDRVVMELLGHTGVGMTARYQHVPPGVLADAAGVLDRVLNPEEAAGRG